MGTFLRVMHCGKDCHTNVSKWLH